MITPIFSGKKIQHNCPMIIGTDRLADLTINEICKQIMQSYPIKIEGVSINAILLFHPKGEKDSFLLCELKEASIYSAIGGSTYSSANKGNFKSALCDSLLEKLALTSEPSGIPNQQEALDSLKKCIELKELKEKVCLVAHEHLKNCQITAVIHINCESLDEISSQLSNLHWQSQSGFIFLPLEKVFKANRSTEDIEIIDGLALDALYKYGMLVNPDTVPQQFPKDVLIRICKHLGGQSVMNFLLTKKSMFETAFRPDCDLFKQLLFCQMGNNSDWLEWHRNNVLTNVEYRQKWVKKNFIHLTPIPPFSFKDELFSFTVVKICKWLNDNDYELLKNDNAKDFISITHYKTLIPYILEDNPSWEAKTAWKIAEGMADSSSPNLDYHLAKSHLHFFEKLVQYLMPRIMAIGACKSFELFIRVYFFCIRLLKQHEYDHLQLYFSSRPYDTLSLHDSMERLTRAIYNFQDPYFIKLFLQLALQYSGNVGIIESLFRIYNEVPQTQGLMRDVFSKIHKLSVPRLIFESKIIQENIDPAPSANVVDSYRDKDIFQLLRQIDMKIPKVNRNDIGFIYQLHGYTSALIDKLARNKPNFINDHLEEKEIQAEEALDILMKKI